MANKQSEALFEKLDGSGNLLITAPHLNPHRRPNLSGALKQGEDHTDYIVRSVCDQTDNVGLIAKDVSEYDPNYHPKTNNPFKDEVRSISKDRQLSGLIDIHGLSDAYKFDMAIFYERGFRNSRDLAYKIAQGFNKDKMRGLLIHILYFKDSEGESISQYAATELKVPAVQVEISRYIRDNEKLRENLIKNLSKTIQTL